MCTQKLKHTRHYAIVFVTLTVANATRLNHLSVNTFARGEPFEFLNDRILFGKKTSFKVIQRRRFRNLSLRHFDIQNYTVRQCQRDGHAHHCYYSALHNYAMLTRCKRGQVFGLHCITAIVFCLNYY